MPKVTVSDGQGMRGRGLWKSFPDQTPLVTDRRLSLGQGRVGPKVMPAVYSRADGTPDLAPARPALLPDEAQLRRHPGLSPPSSLHSWATYTPNGRKQQPQPLLPQCRSPVWEGLKILRVCLSPQPQRQWDESDLTHQPPGVGAQGSTQKLQMAAAWRCPVAKAMVTFLTLRFTSSSPPAASSSRLRLFGNKTSGVPSPERGPGRTAPIAEN